ncbi:MAG: TAXI family TRAP transporter solute-binding subunit [Natronospirillum sp.]|uniref:TAXI family TRAP transporter solute-binding subunit n=1 Tax=Natronospirillum sp. TaxID=2812955 RepID=UPI0026006725|nr:TAXI family TRAP transporter solute-binding subunit [Natronospirillum sp.]MCH8551406.1 TAXI family TRAP transporter solute-binding subunit [Natronospirillum sp.]
MRRLIPSLALGLGLAMGAQADTSLSIATGGTGGVYYPIGGGLGEMIGRHIDGYTGVAEVTGASVENMGLVFREDSDMALALADTVLAAYEGTDPFEGRALENIRALGSIYPNAVQIVVLASSDIHSLSDLAGQRVSVGAPGSGTEVSAQTLLEANGMSYDDFRSTQRLNFNETADALRDGDIDVGFWSVGPPTSSIMSLATSRDIRVIELSQEEIDNAIAVEPTFAPYDMPAGLYEGVDDVLTIGTPNVLVVNEAMDEELAYNITRIMFEYVQELRDVHPAAESTTVPFSLGATPIPLHPGALRYYEEVGADIPDRLR